MREFLGILFDLIGILAILIMTLFMFVALWEALAEKIAKTKYYAQNHVRQLNDEIAELRAKLIACEKVHQAETEKKNKQIEERDNRIKELEEKIQKLRSGEIPPLERERYQTEIENLESRLSNERNKRITLENDLRNANAKIEELSQNTLAFNAPSPVNLDTENLKAQLDKAQSDILSYQDTITALRKELDSNESLKQKNDTIIKISARCKLLEETLTQREAELKQANANLNTLQKKLREAKKDKTRTNDLYREGLNQLKQVFDVPPYSITKLLNQVNNGKLNNAFGSDFALKRINISADIASSKGSKVDIYENVTLYECTCHDFTTKNPNQNPCKHILYLAYELGVLQVNRTHCYKTFRYSVENATKLAPLPSKTSSRKRTEEKLNELTPKN